MTARDPAEVERILQQRARQLAVPEQEAEPEELLDVLVFDLAQERYALDARFIDQVVPLRQLTPVPCTPPHILGIVNVQGRFVSVLDIRRFFDLPRRGLSDLNSVVVLESDTMEFGLLTDRIRGSASISLNQLRRSMANLNGIRSEYLMGITPDQWVVLNAEKLLDDPSLVVNETL